MQRGYIYRSHGAWFVRYRDGSGKQRASRLAPIDDTHHSIKSVRSLAEDIIHDATKKDHIAASAQDLTFQQFVDEFYFPHVQESKRPSTARGYRNLYNAQIKERIGGVKMATFRPVDAQRLLDGIAAEDKNLSHSSFLNIKNLLSSIFRFAVRKGFLEVSAIPSRVLEIPKGRKTQKTYAYSLDEVEKMIQTLKDRRMPNAAAVITVAAWTGLSLAELRGLKWTDIEDDQLSVQRTYWQNVEQAPKTDARADVVYLLPEVRDALAEHCKRNPYTEWVFEGPRGTPMDLELFAVQHIRPVLADVGIRWYGYHALRRGLATSLQARGVSIEFISRILRHKSVHVTRRHYAKVLDASVKKAMDELANRQK